jgi:hypothetical protein
MGGAESVSEGPPDACRWHQGVAVGVGHIYPQVTVPGVWALGYKKCLLETMGSNPMGHGEPLKKGIFPTNFLFKFLLKKNCQ